MPISKEKYLALFLDEFRANLQAAENQVILLKNDAGNEDALATLLRTLHNMKGSARMLQFGSMEALVHGMETVFKGVKEGRYPVDGKLVRFFFIVADHLRAAAGAVEAGRPDAVEGLDALLAACERLAANEPCDLSALPVARSGAMAGTSPQAVAGATEELPHRHETPGGAEAGAGREPLAEERLESTIRVDAETIDRAIGLANTLTIRQLRMRSASELIEALERRLTESYRSAADIRELRKELSGIVREVRKSRTQYAEQLFEIEHGTQELRDTVIGMRMLPLSVVLERFPRMVEEASAALGKDIGVSITGDAVRLDRTVLSKLQDPLVHLVRNAIDHGIETGVERVRTGKPARGSVRISCRTEGSRVAIVVEDDGGGLDYPAIRAKALSLWPEDEAAIRQLADTDLARFLFRPGFSTRSTSTTLSGRGIGLDIVKTNIEAVKGQIHIDSERGKGCRFTLLLPVSASTMDGMFVLCSGRKYFIPAPAIARALLVDESERFQVHQKDMYNYEGVNIPLSELSLALQVERQERPTRKLPVLVVRGATETMGIVVDRILGYDSLVYQPLPHGLRVNRLTQGVVFDSSFNIIPILNMWAVLDRLRSVRLMDTHRRFAATARQARPSILVVDDSASTREIEMSMLELEGFEVTGAIDGVEALEKVHAARFDLVVSDLNMPRMDGLKLLENMRADESLRDLPVVFVTTVGDEETRRRAGELGADAYIQKSDFEQDDLVGTVRALLARGARR